MTTLQRFISVFALAVAFATNGNALHNIMRPPPLEPVLDWSFSDFFDDLDGYLGEGIEENYGRRSAAESSEARSFPRIFSEVRSERELESSYSSPIDQSHQAEDATEKLSGQPLVEKSQTEQLQSSADGSNVGSVSRSSQKQSPQSQSKIPKRTVINPLERSGNKSSRAGFVEPDYPGYPIYVAHETDNEQIRLAWPVVKFCHERLKYAYTVNGDGYYVNSWQIPENRITDPISGDVTFKTFTWAEARSQCRKRCMDAISFENQPELTEYSRVLAANKIPYIWTSGHVCEFKECANRSNLHPLRVKGWVWMANGQDIPDTDKIPFNWSIQPWSRTGVSNLPQPDNADFEVTAVNESCLALINNAYDDRIAFHDASCNRKMHFTCEDSKSLIDLVFQEHQIDVNPYKKLFVIQ